MSYRAFKVGDKVTIRPDLSKHSYCPITGCSIWPDMARHGGKTTTVIDAVTLANNKTYYRLYIDNKYWSWTSFMFQQHIFKRKELP